MVGRAVIGSRFWLQRHQAPGAIPSFTPFRFLDLPQVHRLTARRVQREQMTIDERLEALTMNLELESREIQELRKLVTIDAEYPRAYPDRRDSRKADHPYRRR
jgi:hypothetical protein